MKKSILFITAILLTGCAKSPEHISLDTRLQNPLFAERYSEELVEGLVELKLQNHPLLENTKKEKYLEKEREYWLTKAKESRKTQNKGTKGSILPLESYAKGEALLLDSVLYVGTEFFTTPSPSLHFLLTTVVDPRDTEFPDETSLDLGALQSAYGAQHYIIPEVDDISLYRTVVLWDTELELLVGFAQLRGI